MAVQMSGEYETAGVDTLTVLRAAKARVEGGAEVAYGDWCRCTVGHLVAAVTGVETDDESVVLDAAMGELSPLFDEVVTALGRDSYENHVDSVDTATYHAISAHRGDDRAGVLAVLDAAISALDMAGVAA